MPSDKLQERVFLLLAKREHSRVELQKKLVAKGFLLTEIDALLDKLVAQDLLSDERFTENYVRMRKQAGFGPRRIEAELQQRGLSDSLIAKYLSHHSDDWHEQMVAVWQKKFSGCEDHQRQFRFLSYRGFVTEDIYQLLKGEFK